PVELRRLILDPGGKDNRRAVLPVGGGGEVEPVDRGPRRLRVLPADDLPGPRVEPPTTLVAGEGLGEELDRVILELDWITERPAPGATTLQFAFRGFSLLATVRQF